MTFRGRIEQIFQVLLDIHEIHIVLTIYRRIYNIKDTPEEIFRISDQVLISINEISIEKTNQISVFTRIRIQFECKKILRI